tara:strand:+ start:77 stop:481 length:405 start_codon:yes stop_codon:yes gene_type:complete
MNEITKEKVNEIKCNEGLTITFYTSERITHLLDWESLEDTLKEWLELFEKVEDFRLSKKHKNQMIHYLDEYERNQLDIMSCELGEIVWGRDSVKYNGWEKLLNSNLPFINSLFRRMYDDGVFSNQYEYECEEVV